MPEPGIYEPDDNSDVPVSDQERAMVLVMCRSACAARTLVNGGSLYCTSQRNRMTSGKKTRNVMKRS